MATEAEIIPEPIALVKTEESKHLTLELCEKVVKFLPEELKKFQGELPRPADTDECFEKAGNMQVDSNINGVETMKAVSEGNPEISKTKGESFLISPEISKVAYETCEMSEHAEVDDTPSKAEKIVEDEEKMANDKKFQLEEEEATEDRMEKGDTDHGIEELSLETRAEVEVIADRDSSLEQKHGSIEEEISHAQGSEHEGTKTDELDQQVLGVQEANLELKKQALIDTPDPTNDSLKEANESVTEASVSNLVQEELEEKSFKEVEDTEPEKLPALVGKEEGTEATEPIEISVGQKDQIISDSIGDTDTLMSTVAESSEIEYRETTSEISEIAKKELYNPYEEVPCVQEPPAEVDEKLEEVSGIIIEDKSQATIESTEEIKDIIEENDGIQDMNVLDASSVMKTEELCLQEVDATIEESPPGGEQSEINDNTEQDSGTSSEICKDDADSESENITDKELVMIEASDKEPTVVMLEGNINEVDNIEGVQQSQEEKPENGEILKDSFQQENEPSCPLNTVDEDANTTISSEKAETSTGTKEATSANDQEEIFEGEGMEDTPTNTDAVSKDAGSEEKDQQIEVNDNTKTLEVEIPNKNADHLHAADSLAGQSVEKEEDKQYEFSDFKSEEQVHEANEASNEKEESSADISDTLQSINITKSEQIVTEEAATTDLKSETSEIEKENVRDVSLLDSEKCSENKQVEIQKELEDCTEPDNARENIEDNSTQEETKEVCEGPKSIIKEECAIIDESMKSNEEEMHESFQEDEKEETSEVEVRENLEINTEKQILEEEDINKDQTSILVETMEEKLKEENTGATMSIKEVCKESETAASGTGKENPEIQENPTADSSNSSSSDETVKESIKEDGSSSMKLVEEARNSNVEETTLQNLEETAEPNNDPGVFDIEKESKEEITALEAREDLVRTSSFELEESKKDTEEETSVKESINTADLGSASPATEMEETNMKEAEPEEKKEEINNVLAVEDNSLATTEHEGISIDSADIDVGSSTLCEKEETLQEDDGMQYKDHADHSNEELNLDTGGEERVEVKVIADEDSSLEEKCGSIEEETSHSQESEHEGTKTHENEDNMESDEQVLGIEEADLELKKQAIVGTPNTTTDSFKEANETVTEAINSNLVQEELEEKSFKEVKDIETEKPPSIVAKEEETEATEHIEISGSEKDQIISDSIGDTSTSTSAEISEIKDHETALETSEEVACVHEPVPEVDEKLKEVSSIITEDKSQATIEPTEESKDIKAEELCIQKVDNRNMCNIASDIRTETNIEESPTEESEQSEINDKMEQDLGTSSDKCKYFPNSESEKFGVEAKAVQVIDKELDIAEASDEMKRDEEPAVPSPEGNISEVENIDVVQKNQEGTPENDEILKESSVQQQNEPEKEETSCPLNGVDEDANTAISTENAETSTCIKDETSVKDQEERFQGEGMEDTPIKTDAVSKDAESEEKDQQIEVNENTELLEVEQKDANEDIEDNLKQEESIEVSEVPKSTIKEECAIIIDGSMKSTEEEMHESFQEETPEEEVFEKLERKMVEDPEKQFLEEEDANKEEEPKEENTCAIMSIKEVCKESESVASGIGKENSEMEEHPIADISNLSITDETVKESIKEDESSSINLVEEASDTNIEEKDSTEGKTLQNLEETTEPSNDPSLLDIEKDSKEEITALEAKEDIVCTSLLELEESKKDTEEETSVKETNSTSDLGSASPAAEMEETNIKEAEPDDKKDEINNVLAVEENGLAKTEHEGTGISSVDIDVKQVDSSTLCEKVKTVPQEEEAMQDNVPNTASEDQMEAATMEISLKEISGGAVKEYSNMPSEEYDPTTEERKITDETSEKNHAPEEHSETSVSQATTDEMLIQKEDISTLYVPRAESDDTEKKSGQEFTEHLAEEPYVHTEQEPSKCSSVSEVINVSNVEEPRELENESDSCKEEKLQDEQSSDIGLEGGAVEDGTPLDEATDVGETLGTSDDREKAIQEENLAKNLENPESLKEDTELPRGAHDLIPKVINMNDNAKNVELAPAAFEEKPKFNSETVVEDQSNETLPELSKSLADKTRTDVQNQETEKQITEELEDKVDGEDHVNREQNADEVTKAVILSEEVDKEVEKDDHSEGIKQHVVEEENSTDELHLESKGDETTNKVEDYTSVSTECLKEVDSKRQIEARESEVEEHSTEDQTTQLTETMEEKNTGEIKSTEKVCKESETAASGTGKENPEMEEHPRADIFNPSISDEPVKESIKEDESSPIKLIEEASNSNIEETDSTEETTLKNLEETEEPDNDPSWLDIEKESKEEITALEAKEESSFELEESKKDTVEETSVKGTIDTADFGSASPAADTEETNIKEAEPEEKMNEISNVLAVEENSLATTEHESVDINNADIDVKLVDSSTLCEKVKENPQEEDGMQDKIPITGSEDQMEMATGEIPLEGDAVKECSNMPSDGYEPTPMEETKITDEHLETLVPQAKDEVLIQEDDNPALDAPETESEYAEKESGHEVKEHLAEEPYGLKEEESRKSSSLSEVTDFSNVEEPRELENESDACKAETLQDKQSSDVEREEVEDGKPMDEAKDVGETFGTYNDREKAIQEEENIAKDSAKPESLKEDTELPKGAQDQIPEVINVNDDAKDLELAQAGFEEKPMSDSETPVEDQSKETFPEASKNLSDETSTDVQNQEVEKQITEEQEDKVDNEDCANREQNANEVTKAVILSEEQVNKEVENADDDEDIKEHVIEEESSTNELHLESKGDESTTKVEDYTSVSAECLKEADSDEQIEARELEVEEHSTKDREASLVIKESEERRQDEESEDPVAVHDTIYESELCEDKKDVETVTKASEEIDVVTGDVITGEQTLSANKPGEGTTSFALLSDEQEEETIVKIEKIDEEKLNEAEILEEKISEDSSKADIFPEREEFKELEDAKNDEITAAQAIQVEEPNEQSLPSALPSESIEHAITANEEEEEKVMEVEMLGKERFLEPEAVVDQETTVAQVSITEESMETETIGTVEKLDEEKRKKAENLEDDICEDLSARETEDICLHKEEPDELNAVPEEGITSGQTFLEEQIQISTSGITSEELELETKKTEDEETDKEEAIKDEISEDASDARTTGEICSQKERSIELDVVVEDEMTAGQTLTEDKSEEQVQNQTSALPFKEVERGNTSITEKIESEKIEEAEFLQDDIREDVSLQKEQLQETDFAEETTLHNLEETAETNHDPILLDVVNESKEDITTTEAKQVLVHTSSFELEENKEDNEEETSVKEGINTADFDSASPAAEIEEANMKEINNVVSVEGIGVDSTDIDVKPADSSTSCEKEEIPIKEKSGDEVEYSTMASEEYESTAVEERINDQTSETEQALDEHSETPVSQGREETLMQKEDNPLLYVPKAESGDGKERGEKSLQDEQSSDIGVLREKVEDGKPLDEAMDVGETSSSCNYSKKAIQEEENLANLAKPESLEEDTEVEREETEPPRAAHDQIPEVINVDDNAKNVELAQAGFEDEPRTDSEAVVEDQTKESEYSKSQVDVPNQETEKQVTKEPEEKVDNEDYVNGEQKANEVTKAVILSEEVDKEVEKVDDSEDIKEHVIVEESSTNELHPESKEDQTTNEVEDYNSVSTECIEEADTNNQIEARKSAKDREASITIKESEERISDEESSDPVTVQGADKESEKKIEDIVDESKLCQEKSDIEAVTERAETSLNHTEMDGELVNTSNISSETAESDANQETKALQLEEVSADLAPPVSTNDNDEVEIIDKDEDEEIKRDPDEAYLSKDQIDEAERSLTVEKVDQLPNNDHELVETMSEASKTSNADELGKTELASDADNVSKDKGTEQEAETNKSQTGEELKANEAEETIGVPETSSDYLSQTVETVVDDDISSHNTLPEEKLQTSASTLPSKDEDVKTPNSIEKIVEEIQKDAMEETVVDQKEIQTTSSTFHSEEATGAVSEEIDVVTGDGMIGEHTLSANKPDEGTTSLVLLSKKQDDETTSTVEKIDEAEIPEDKSLGNSSDAKKTADTCLEKDQFQELEDAKTDETAAAQTIQVEEQNEQSLTSALPSENIEHGTTAIEEGEEAEVKEVERPQEPVAVEDQENTLAQASISEESLEIETVGTGDKLDEEERKEAESLKEEICGDSSARETEDLCLQKEEPNDLNEVPKEGITSGQTFLEGQSDEQFHISTAIITSEELEHETKKTEDEETNKDEIADARTTEEICSQMERSIQLEAVVEDEMTADHTLNEKKSEEQVENPASALPSKEEECGNTSGEIKEFLQDDDMKDVSLQNEQLHEDKALAEDENVSSQIFTTEKSEEKIPNPVATLPSEEHKHETVSKVDETEEENVKEEEMQNEDSEGAKTNDGNEIILNEVSKEEVIEDEEVTKTSYSTSHSEELTKNGSGEDKPSEDKTNEALETTTFQNQELIVEPEKSDENDIIEKHIVCEDKTVEDPGQASVARIETTAVTEEESSIELSQAEGAKDLAESNQIIDDIQQQEIRTNIASDQKISRETDPIENAEITSSIGKEHDDPIDLQDSTAESSQKAEAGDVKEIYSKEAEVDHSGEKITDNSSEDITKESISVEVSTKVSSSDDVESFTKETLQVTQEEREEKDETGAVEIPLVEKPEEQSPAPSSKLPSKEQEQEVSTEVDPVKAKEQKEVEILDKDSSETKTEGNANETLKAPTNEIQMKELSAETLNDGGNNNLDKEIVAEDVNVEVLEQAPVGMKQATIVKEKIPGEADPTEGRSIGDLEPENAQEICTEAVVDNGEEKKIQEPASLYDLLQRSTREKKPVSEEREADTVQEKETKPDEEERDDHDKTDSGSDAPVMVEAPRDTDTKPHKKSNNILLSKVKHSISKVKKAITGKSSHSKESKSPKGSEK